jgi:uncharacterized protein involved in exopolysaccharide biosynthesis
MELRFLWQLCRAYWRFITVTTVVATLLGLAATYVLPESFEASTDILIRPEQKPTFQTGSASGKTMDYPVSFNIPPDTMSDTYGSIMTSTAIATRVEDQLQLHTLKDPWPDQWWLQALFTLRDYARTAVFDTWDTLRYGRVEPQLPPYWHSVKDIKDGLDAKTVNKTYIFTLTATWSDPDLAVKIADTAAQAFVDYSREARTREEGTSAGLLAEQVKVTSEKLANARAQLDAFKRESGTEALDQELQLRLDGISRFENEREKAKKELAEADAELGELANLTSGTTELKTLRGDSRSQVESKRADRLATRKALAARIASLTATIDRYKHEATELGAGQSQQSQLALEVSLLEDNYKMLVKSYEEARIDTVQALSEIRVVHAAVRPRYPEGPIKIYYAGGGLLTGLLLALGLVLLIDYMDHRIRSRDEIERLLGVPVLASVPHAGLPASAALLLAPRASHAAGVAWDALPHSTSSREDRRNGA